ncbi:type II secretion system F family protein [bacterium]|nr:type II secretion system F family protein [bacterium]
MPNFSYKAVNEQGKEITGVIEASDAVTAQRMLESQNLMPMDVRAGGAVASTDGRKPAAMSASSGKRKKISARDVIDFTRQLTTLLKAGVPILSALETLSGQAVNPNFGDILIKVAEDIASGEDFSAALGKHPKVFNDLYTNSVKAGEIGGVLDTVLTRIADVLKRDSEILRKVKGALRYPLMVVIGMGIAFAVLITLVVPTFADIFEQVGLELPLPTVILMVFANTILDYWWALILGIGSLIFGFTMFLKNEKGRRMWDGWILRIPIFGPLLLKTAMTRFTSMFEVLSRAGLPILQIFQVISRTMGNVVLAEALAKASEGIERGREVAVSLADTGLFPPLVVKMISVGEASGALDDMLANIAEYYEEEVSNSVEGLTSLIEPILTLGMGGMVLMLMLAIFLPMWDMMQMAQQ